MHAGSGRGVVVATGAGTEFGSIAAGLGTHQLDTEFQIGLRRFSVLLVYVAGALTTAIDSALFSPAIAVGVTPQLLPAVVSSSLAAGSRRMRARKVLVKRLVCIEDLGDVDVLFTDKTGTLTAGRIDFMRAVPAGDQDGGEVLRRGPTLTPSWRGCPFDHERRMVSVLVQEPDGSCALISKGARRGCWPAVPKCRSRPGRRSRPSSPPVTGGGGRDAPVHRGQPAG